MNNIGSFVCTCNDGYELESNDPLTCIGKLSPCVAASLTSGLVTFRSASAVFS